MNTDRESEVWLPVAGHPYKVSNLGRIKSNATGKHIRLTKNNGYLGFVSYYRGNEKYLYVHRCEMIAFQPRENMDNLCVNHIDFDRSNNKLNNLEWTTHMENQRHSLKHNRYLKANKAHSEFMKVNTFFIRMRKPVVLIKDTAIIECQSATEAAKIVGVELSILARAARAEKETNGFKAYYL